MQLEKLADMVVLTVKTALAPVLERVAAAEARLLVLGDLRDRVVMVETKSSEVHDDAPSVDLSPVCERVAVLEATLVRLESAQATVSDLRDRVVSMETKAALPTPVVETRTDGPSSTDVELAITKAIAPISERLAVIETRAPIPGPVGQPGADGTAGKDGLDGKDGADGLGVDDLMATQQDDRSFTIKAVRGDRVKDIGTARFPVQIQRGVYIDGKSYEQGDVVTWGGSQWHANEDTTTKPGDGSKAWILVVKRGRDGKDGRDGVDRMPVVSVGGAR